MQLNIYQRPRNWKYSSDCPIELYLLRYFAVRTLANPSFLPSRGLRRRWWCGRNGPTTEPVFRWERLWVQGSHQEPRVNLCLPCLVHPLSVFPASYKTHGSKICSVKKNMSYYYSMSKISNWLSKQLLWNAVFRFILQQGPPMMNAAGINALGVFLNLVYHYLDEIKFWLGAYFIFINVDCGGNWPTDCYFNIRQDPQVAKGPRWFWEIWI